MDQEIKFYIIIIFKRIFTTQCQFLRGFLEAIEVQKQKERKKTGRLGKFDNESKKIMTKICRYFSKEEMMTEEDVKSYIFMPGEETEFQCFQFFQQQTLEVMENHNLCPALKTVVR